MSDISPKVIAQGAAAALTYILLRLFGVELNTDAVGWVEQAVIVLVGVVTGYLVRDPARHRTTGGTA